MRALAASTDVDALFIMASATDAANVANSIATTSTSEMQTSWFTGLGLTINSQPTAAAESALVLAPSPPPPSPPPPSPPPADSPPPDPPPPPMVAYHYWKCYHKESSAFQTASLFSIEVDYYHFGTCEISDGSYFCGDHSCSTYKHVGAKDVVENLEVGENTMTLQSTDVDCSPSTDWFTSAHGSEECQELCLSNGYTYAIVHPDLSCKCAGASECNVMNTQSLGTWLIYKKSTKPAGYNRHAQPQTDGFVNRMDNTAGQYEKIDDHWLSETDISSRDVLRWLANMVDSKLSHGPEAKALYVTPWHLQRNIVADGVDSCVKACDRDATCRAYQESRWATLSYVAPTCFLFHMPFVSSYSDWPLTIEADLDAAYWQKASTATDRTLLADFYCKVSNKKAKTWLHVPKVTPLFPNPAGVSPDAAITEYGGKYSGPSGGRRLEGVY